MHLFMKGLRPHAHVQHNNLYLSTFMLQGAVKIFIYIKHMVNEYGQVYMAISLLFDIIFTNEIYEGQKCLNALLYICV